MPYINRVLQQGETVIYRGRIHWIAYYWSVILFFVTVIFALMAVGADNERDTAVFLGDAMVYGIEIIVTDKRVLLKEWRRNGHGAAPTLAARLSRMRRRIAATFAFFVEDRVALMLALDVGHGCSYNLRVCPVCLLRERQLHL